MSSMPVILIRADASSSIGLGHIARCMTLQQALQRAGFQIVFACAAIPDLLKSQIIRNGGKVEMIPHERTDALSLGGIAHFNKAAAIILDSYQIDSDDQRQLYSSGIPVIILDDLNDRGRLFASLIINSLPHAGLLGYEKTAPDAILLAGLEYALLRTEFSQIAGTECRSSQRSRLLINFGGSDILRLSLPLSRALLDLDGDLPLTLITGSGYPKPEEAERLAGQYANVEHIHDCSDMASQFLRAGLALAAPGSTIYELAACQVPAVFLICADNQALSARAHEERGWCRVFDGRDNQQCRDAIISTLKLWNNPEQRDELQKSTIGLVPIDGADRIAKKIKRLVESNG